MNLEKTAYVLVIVIAMVFILKAAQILFMPLTIAVIVSLLLMPPVNSLSRFKIPRVLAALLVLGLLSLVFAVLIFLFTVSLNSLNQKIPFYGAQLNGLAHELITSVRSMGILVEPGKLVEKVDFGKIGSLLTRGVFTLTTVAANYILVFFISLLVLTESDRIRQKVLAFFRDDPRILESTSEVAGQISRYLFWKTVISAATGTIVFIFLQVVGVDFALLWGLLAFVLNYIPSVGSIVASIPPVIIALVQFDNGLAQAAVVTAGLLATQVTIGNFIDPKIQGRELNFSALLVFVNMILWGFIWGPIGMILSTPLLVCIKVAFSFNNELEGVGRLFSK